MAPKNIYIAGQLKLVSRDVSSTIQEELYDSQESVERRYRMGVLIMVVA